MRKVCVTSGESPESVHSPPGVPLSLKFHRYETGRPYSVGTFARNKNLVSSFPVGGVAVMVDGRSCVACSAIQVSLASWALRGDPSTVTSSKQAAMPPSPSSIVALTR